MSQNYNPKHEMNLPQKNEVKGNTQNLGLNPSSSNSKVQGSGTGKENRKKFSKIYAQAKFEEEEDEILKRVISGNKLFRDSSYDYRFSKLIFPRMFKKQDEEETVVWTRLSKIYNISEFDLFDRGVRHYGHYTLMFDRLRKERMYYKPNNQELGWIKTHFNYFNACNLLIGSYGIQVLERLFDQDNSFYKDVGAFKVTLNVGGIWTEYLIDDFMPLKTGGKMPEEFLYSGALRDSSEGIYEVWLLVLEKALSKAFKGYAKLGDIPVFEFMRCLTGAPYELYRCGDLCEELEGFETGEIETEEAWSLIKKALSRGHQVNFSTIEGNMRKLRRLERFNTSQQTISLVGGVHYAIESILDIESKGRFVILDTNSNVKLHVPLEEFIKECDYITVLKFDPSYTYNSSHIPLSEGHFLQSVAKFGIQEGGSYTIQLEQKCPFFFPRDSRFKFNSLGVTLAYLRENSIEYIGHKIAERKSKLTFEIDNFEGEEVKIIMLIDVECDETNTELSEKWKGDLRHWRDLVVSIYGSEFSTINSLALDKNRGMVYDFFLHRIWREFSRSDSMKKEGQEVDVKAWEMEVEVEGGDKKKVQFMRQGCQLGHLTLYKFTNFSKSQIKLEEILDCELDEGLECFGPFEVNNINPSIVLNPSSNDIMLFKYNDKISRTEGIRFKNSGFKVKLTDLENSEDLCGQDPYEHVMKQYKVQSSRTYPSFTYEIHPMAGLDLNRFFERMKKKFKLEEPVSVQASEEATVPEEPLSYSKVPGEELGTAPVRIKGTVAQLPQRGKSRERSGAPAKIKRHPSQLSTEEIKIEVEGVGDSLVQANKVESLKVSGVEQGKPSTGSNTLRMPADNFGNIGVSFGDYGENSQLFSAARARSKSKDSKKSREARIMFDSLESQDKNKHLFQVKSKEKSIFNIQGEATPKEKREAAVFQGVSRENQKKQLLSFGEDLGLENLPKEIRTNPPTIPSISKSSSRKIAVSHKTSNKDLSKGVSSSSGHNTFVHLQSAPSSQSRLGSITEKPEDKTPNTVFSEISKQGANKIQIRDYSRKEMEQKQMMISEIKSIGKKGVARPQKTIEKHISVEGMKKSEVVAAPREAKSEIGRAESRGNNHDGHSGTRSPNIPSTHRVQTNTHQGSSKQTPSDQRQNPYVSPNRGVSMSIKADSAYKSVNSQRATFSPSQNRNSIMSKDKKDVRGSGNRKQSIGSVKNSNNRIPSKDKKTSQPVMNTNGKGQNEGRGKSRTAGNLRKKSDQSPKSKKVVIRADNSGVRQQTGHKEARSITPFRDSSQGKEQGRKPRSKVSLASKTQRVTGISERKVNPAMPPKNPKNGKAVSPLPKMKTSGHSQASKGQDSHRSSQNKTLGKDSSQPRETRPTANFASVAVYSNHGSVGSKKESGKSIAPITTYFPREASQSSRPGQKNRSNYNSQNTHGNQSRVGSVDSKRQRTPSRQPSAESKKRQQTPKNPLSASAEQKARQITPKKQTSAESKKDKRTPSKPISSKKQIIKGQTPINKSNRPPKSTNKTPKKRRSAQKKGSNTVRTPKAPFSKPPINNSARAVQVRTPMKGSVTARAGGRVHNPFVSSPRRNCSSNKHQNSNNLSIKKSPIKTKAEMEKFHTMKRNMLKNTCRGLTPTIVSTTIPTPLRYSTNTPMGHQKVVRMSSRKKSRTREKVVIKADGISRKKIGGSSSKTSKQGVQTTSRHINLNQRFSKGIKLNESLNMSEVQAKQKENKSKAAPKQKIEKTRQRKIMLDNPFAVNYVKQGRVFVRGGTFNRQTFGVPRSTTPIGVMSRRNNGIPKPKKL